MMDLLDILYDGGGRPKPVDEDSQDQPRRRKADRELALNLVSYGLATSIGDDTSHPDYDENFATAGGLSGCEQVDSDLLIEAGNRIVQLIAERDYYRSRSN